MNRPGLNNALSRWMMHERRGDETGAEKALGELLRGLPLAVPARGFAERVLRVAGVAAAPRPAAWSSRAWPFRLVLGTSLLLGGLAAAYLPGLFLTLADPLDPRRPVEWSASLLLGASRGLAEGLGWWDRLAELGIAVGRALATPGAAALLALCALASAIAFRLLCGLMTPERRHRHVDR